jgi:SNF2 family DNA or RNA helicase
MKSYKKYGYLWVTLILFLGAIIGHWIFAYYAYVNEQSAHEEPIVFKDYLVEVSRDTLENWQSEFLQLIWQVAGLAFLLYVGSPQSKEGDDRHEAKLDEILKSVNKEKGEEIIREFEKKYPKK